VRRVVAASRSDIVEPSAVVRIPVGDRREVRLGHVQLRNVRTTRNALLDREGEISMRAGFEVARRGDLTTPERPPFGKSLAVENDESAIGERGFGDSHVR